MQMFWSSIFQSKLAAGTVGIFALFVIWWLEIFYTGAVDQTQNHWFGFSYGSLSIWGGVIGLAVSRKWGGWGSLIGRAIICLSLGLLLQGWGQYSFWYMNSVMGIEIPYPSIPDIGYFGTIPFYIYASYLLAKAAGAKSSISSLHNGIQLLIIPVLMLGIAYFSFLRDLPFDSVDPLASLMDYAYPTGQALYISGALLTYSLSRKLLGGVMRFPILFLVVAFMVQFAADYIYIYFHAFYYPGSFVDFFYLLSYFIMSLGLIQLKVTADNLQKI
jgi:hypothetical protein